MPPVDTAIITTLRAFDTNDEKDQRSFRPKSQGDEVEKSIQNRFLDSAFGSARNDCEGVRKMNEPNSKAEKPQEKRRYDPELLKKGLHCDLDQYEMLKRCSDKKDMTEWSEWRKNNFNEDIFLEGANFSNRLMKKVNLMQMKKQVSLKGANFMDADLEKSLFMHSNLDGADFTDALLPGALFSCTSLKGANFTLASVDGQTVIWKPKVNRYSKKSKYTDFTGVSLDTLRIDPGTKQLLEYNIRRKNWKEWYLKQHWLVAWLVHKFWEISDYGISTKGIIKTFFKWAFVFAIVYYACGCIDYYLLSNKDYPGIVSNLFVLEDSKQAVSGWLVPLRAVYFSIVTMTTLGFGDMYANAHSLFRGIFGHILLALQVTLGYVLLGALVTRFAVLFTAGGPAGKFADEKE